jgi:hypothetical protein
MVDTRIHSERSERNIPLRRLLITTAAISFSAITSLTLPTEKALANPIDYVIAPNSTTTLDGSVETIAGYFTYDAVTNFESDVSITLTGNAPYDGTYAMAGSSSLLGIDEIYAVGSGGTVELTFSNPFGLAPDPLEVFVIIGNSYGNIVDFAPTGDVSANVPEPSSLAILGAGLGLFGFRRRFVQPSPG